MIKRIIIVFALIYSNSQALTLESAQELARKNFPLHRQFDLNKISSEKKALNLDAQYYPEMSLYASAQYQSETSKLPISLPIPNFSMPEIDKDQYKVQLRINQLIWDGGLISTLKELDIEQEKIDNQNIEIELLKLKQRVNDLYFGVLSIDAKLQIYKILVSDLEEKLNLANAKIKGGASLPASADIIKVEIIKTRQNIDELKALRQTSINSLAILLGKKLESDETLVIPEVNIEDSKFEKNNRPEFITLGLSAKKADISQKTSDSKLLPKISAFAQAGYSKPGLNMFDSKFDSYYIFGAQAQWSFFNWGQSDREKEISEIQKNIIALQEENLEKNIKISIDKELNDISKIEKQIQSDQEIIILKNNIVKQYKSMFENGIVNSQDLTTEMNSKAQAEINMELRKIDLVKTKVNYLTILGK